MVVAEDGDTTVRVAIDGNGKSLLLEHASAMLTVMFRDNKPLFGYYLSKGITGEAPRGPRGGS